jgi:hypothetical protein
MLRFNMKTDTSQGTWRKLLVEKTGSSSNVLKPYGRNQDVRFIRIFRDANSNDVLDASDIAIASPKTTLKSGISSGAVPPFDLVVESTDGFSSSGDLLLADLELMHYVSVSTSASVLRIASRSGILGEMNTSALTLSTGAVVEKVDLYDQVDDNNRVRMVDLAIPQLLSPSQQTYFLTYDIGNSATIGNGVGVKIPGPNAIIIDQPPDVVSGKVNVGVSQFPQLPEGTTSQTLPFETVKALIGGTIFKISGVSLAPKAAEPGTSNMTFLRLEIQTDQGTVDLGAMRFTQTGTGYCASAYACDLISVSLYADTDRNSVYSSGDAMIGKTPHRYQTGGTSDFELGIATVNIFADGLPRLRVGTSKTTVFVVGEIGASNLTLGHSVGLTLASYGDIRAPGGLAGLSAVPDPVKQPPVASGLVIIAPLVVPSVAVSTSAVPIITTLAGPGISSVAEGYPAYALVSTQPYLTINGITYSCNAGKDPAFVRNNICKDSSNNYVPDQSRWICADGLSWLANCPSDPPLMDINGDRVPDNFSVGADPRLTRLSLIGDSIPSRDMVGSKVLEMDLNQDGIPDQVTVSVSGERQMLLGTDVMDPAKTQPAPDQGFVPSAWTGNGQYLKATLPMVNASEGYYEVAAGRFYDEPESLSGTWKPVGTVGAAALKAGMRAGAFAVLAAGAPLTAATITGLALPVPNFARLTQDIGLADTQFTVDDGSKLQLPGIIYVGSEIMRLDRVQGSPNTLKVLPSDTDTGRGLRGSAPIIHLGSNLGGEPVSDDAAIFSARFTSVAGSSLTVSAVRSLFVFRFDPAAPTVPGVPRPQIAAGSTDQTTYEVKWDPSVQSISGVAGYEVQERGGEISDLQANVVWRPLGFVPGRAPSYFTGSSSFPGETPRPRNQFFFYRARAMSNAGVFSSWSNLDTPVATGVLPDVISNLRNYPNPFDPRKGGIEGKTAITYMLADNAEVTLTLYDLLGYVVKELKFSSGSEGGKAGPNIVTWDGRNSLGGFVSKGGYIARVKASSPKGSKIIIRKIGVIH